MLNSLTELEREIKPAPGDEKKQKQKRNKAGKQREWEMQEDKSQINRQEDKNTENKSKAKAVNPLESQSECGLEYFKSLLEETSKVYDYREIDEQKQGDKRHYYAHDIT
jgi:hypothetical protein